MLKVNVFMKSGNIIEFYTAKLEARSHSRTGELTSLKWEKVPGYVGLFDIKLSDIDAITTLDISDDGQAVN